MDNLKEKEKAKENQEKLDDIKRAEYLVNERAKRETALLREIEEERKRQAVAEAEREAKQRREKAAFDEAMRKADNF